MALPVRDSLKMQPPAPVGVIVQGQTFLELVRERLESSNVAVLHSSNSHVRHGMLQIHFGNPRVHYELWLQRRTSRVELGLHFEDEPEANKRWCALFTAQVYELQELLGPLVELEEWTASWSRLHLTVPLEPLEPAFAERLAELLGRLIGATAMDVQAGLPQATAAFRGR